MVLLLHFKKRFGIIYFIIRKVSHLAWHAGVFILPVLGVGWQYASVEVPLLMIPLPFPRMMIDEWLWSVSWNDDWQQTLLSTWRKSCRWAACHFKNFETGSEAHPVPSLISSRGSSPGPKPAEAWSWPLTSISCWGYGSVQMCVHFPVSSWHAHGQLYQLHAV